MGAGKNPMNQGTMDRAQRKSGALSLVLKRLDFTVLFNPYIPGSGISP